MNIMIGTILGLKDEDNFIITFKIPNYIEKGVAYPIDCFDKPDTNDAVLIYEIDTPFGNSFLWQRIKKDSALRLKYKDNTIEYDDDSISITSSKGDKSIKITLDNDGGITLTGNNNSSLSINLGSGSIITMPSGTVVPTGKNGPFVAAVAGNVVTYSDTFIVN